MLQNIDLCITYYNILVVKIYLTLINNTYFEVHFCHNN